MNSIKTRLREYLRNKGITPNEQGMIPCPWHEDNHPSCKVNDEYIYCFTCNESGDIYTAAAALLDIPCDKEHFPAIARDVESTLGIVSDWKPAKRLPGEPRVTAKLSQSAVYRDLLLKDFAAALDGGDMERAFNKASLLLALFMLPDGTASGAPEKLKRTMQDKVSAYCGVSL
ncbi:hypothetical protein AGMMS50267_14300 [Spirochaetia bacterium]|nr:hypothetical protein AGMMS50267_14300 [Spirochaetia bacterium]